ncbi:MAG: 5'-nucleotidase [Gammaproteobacteria bacterium CG_4_10_14_0_8_um_filter_38_16]|nr:MAG: 5'-nucleotidase [Gammaproteobacteria bacterium CG_4_10_14_0_8_um_filter_38_16]PJA02606.1 MAG: 5'-nucleotidase [Gammaproteobacteria bacterium CG_4_10_14_0_2_um_filter_38_22]PJB10563.1 MAG: 5'-nucleotidase [Gammaproteobacteria bacterium CG_4_9_14_3_um_filter_38_9]
MSTDISHKLVVAISSRALFNLDESNAIYEKEGVEKYAEYQIQHENEMLKPGIAFSLVQKLLHLNTHGDLVEMILLSRNSADTGLRIFNSIKHYGLNITRAAFTSGESPYQYVQAFGSHLFLSANPDDVKQALNAGCAAATILASSTSAHETPELRIAFDGDAVLFSNESEKIFQRDGIDAFTKHEVNDAKNPLPGGPFKGFLKALQQLQKQFKNHDCPVRTALVTARQAPTHERVIRTLREWDIRIDEALFLGGLAKGTFLKAFQADIFFDDQQTHCDSASRHVTTAHVPNN